MATLKNDAVRRPDLSPEVISILLCGIDAPSPPEPSPWAGFAHGMLEVFEPDGPARLWRTHERFLRQTAARWGWQPTVEAPGSRRLFWAEAVAEGVVRAR